MDENDPHFDTRAIDTYYSRGGAAMKPANKPPLIHAGIRELRKYIGGIEAKPSKDQYGPKFPVKSAKELFNKLAQGLNDLDMICYVVAQQFNHAPYEFTAKDGQKKTGSMIHVMSVVRLAASDGSYVDFVGSGHGRDNEDKAGGKASTYAWKDALLKGLTIGEQDIDDTDNEGDSVPAGLAVPATSTPPAADKPRRGRPPGTGKNVVKQEEPKPSGDPDADYVIKVNLALATAKNLAEVYTIRDEQLKPRSKAIQEACTPAYIAARDKYKV